MKSFREYLDKRLYEAVEDRPAIKLKNITFDFSYRQDVYEKGYNPNMDRGERSDSGIVGQNRLQSNFTGDVVIPLTSQAVEDIRRTNNDNIGPDAVESFLLSFRDGEKAVEYLDLPDALFSADFSPRVSTEHIPDEAYNALKDVAAENIDENDFEVIYV